MIELEDPFKMTEQERNDLLSKLVMENATCVEISMRTGFIPIYEEGQPKCKCASCNDPNIAEWNKRMDSMFVRVK